MSNEIPGWMRLCFGRSSKTTLPTHSRVLVAIFRFNYRRVRYIVAIVCGSWQKDTNPREAMITGS